MTPRILIVDNDPQYARWLRHHVEAIWSDVDPDCHNYREFEARLGTLNADFDLLLLGTHFAPLPDADSEGYQWLRKLRKQHGLPPVVVIAAGGSELAAVKALRLGASDYLPRDLVTPALLARRLNGVLHKRQRSAQGARRTGRRNRSRRSAARTASYQALRSVIPHYSLLHQVGESARASVWLARSDALGKTVALKISKPGPGDDDNTQLFAREYAALAALRHPSIVDIYDYGIYNHCEYLAMEYFPCGDLKQRLLHPLVPTEALDYTRRIAAALCAVHEAGMMHRDLKPPNVMLREDRSIVLIDFGLAKRVDSDTHSTAIGVLRGSPYYMSPEQVRGLPLDPRSDLYSLGVVLYEMLTGRKPYVGTTAIELMEKHVAGKRAPLPPELAQFETLLAPLMATEREDRFPDAATLLEVLDELQQQLAQPDTALELADVG